jgi:hypothetical protein
MHRPKHIPNPGEQPRYKHSCVEWSDTSVANKIGQVCQSIKRVNIDNDIDDGTRTIYIQIFELLCNIEDHPHVHQAVVQQIEDAVQCKLVHYFQQKVHLEEHTLLYWNEFIEKHFQQFEAFYNKAFQPFIVFAQDAYATPFVKNIHHPFYTCVSQMKVLFQSHYQLLEELIISEIQLYVKCATEYVVCPTDHEEVLSPRYLHQLHILQNWIVLSPPFLNTTTHTQNRTGSAIESIEIYFVSYLQNNILHQCNTPQQLFTRLRKILSVSIQHFKTFSVRPADDLQQCDQPNPTDDIECRVFHHMSVYFSLQEQWSMSSLCFHNHSNETNSHSGSSIFVWKDVLDAFINKDVKLCQLYWSQMYSDEHPLHNRSPFTNKDIRQYLCNCTAFAAQASSSSVESMRDLWSFIYRFFEDGPIQLQVFNTVGHIMHTTHMCERLPVGNTDKDHQETEWCIDTFAALFEHRHTPADVCGFIALWQSITDKNVFMEQLFMRHIQPAILTKTLNVSLFDQMFMQYIESHQSQCTHHFGSLRDMLREYQYRSHHNDAYVINTHMWKGLSPHKPSANHPQIEAVLQSETDKYHKTFQKRTVNWNTWVSMCTTEYTWKFNHKKPLLMTLYSNITIANICLYIHEQNTVSVDVFIQHHHRHHHQHDYTQHQSNSCIGNSTWCLILNELVKDNILEKVYLSDNSETGCVDDDDTVLIETDLVRLRIPTTTAPLQLPLPTRISQSALQRIHKLFVCEADANTLHNTQKHKALYEMKSVIQSVIMARLKSGYASDRLKHISSEDLFSQTQKHLVMFEIPKPMFQEVLDTLVTKEYVDYDPSQTGYLYIP